VGTTDGTLDVNAALTITQGTLDMDTQTLDLTGGSFSNSGTLRLQNTETLTNFTNDTDSGTIEYDGAGNYTSFIAGNNYQSLTLSGGTHTLNAALDMNGNLSIGSTTLDFNGYDPSIGGNLTSSGTLSNTAPRTLTLDGGTQSIDTDNATWDTVAVSSGAGTTTLASNLTTTSALTVASGDTLALSSYTLTSNGTITNAGTINENSGGIVDSSSNFYIGDSNFDIDPDISMPGDKVYVTLTDEDGNLDAGSADTISITVSCPNDSEAVTLTETGNTTEVFRNAGLTTSVYDGDNVNDDGILECADTETITASYTDGQDGTDTQTDTATATTDTTATAPSSFAGTADSGTQITWTWTDNASDETGFKIYDGSDSLMGTVTTANTTSWEETGLSEKTEYSRYAVAYNGAGNSTASSTVAVTTKVMAPTTLIGTAQSSTSILWSWTDNSSNETGFKVYTNTTGTLIETIATASTTSYLETDLTKNTEYSRYVVAYDSAGSSNATASVGVTTPTSKPDTFALISPINGALINTTSPTLSWYKAIDTDDGIDYHILTVSGTSYTIPGDSTEATNPITKTHFGTNFTVQYFNENDGNETNDKITVTLSGVTLTSASHSWSVTQYDNAGNFRASGSRSFTIDSTNPTFTDLTDITVTDTKPSITIKTSDNNALNELTITLKQAHSLLGVITSYTNIQTSTFTLTGTQQDITFTPQNDLILGDTYQLALTLTDTAGNTINQTIQMRALTEEEANKLALDELDADSSSMEDIIEALRGLLPPSILNLPELQTQAILHREKQAQQLTQLIDNYRWVIPVGGEVERVVFSVSRTAYQQWRNLGRFTQGMLANLNNYTVKTLASLTDSYRQLTQIVEHNRLKLAQSDSQAPLTKLSIKLAQEVEQSRLERANRPSTMANLGKTVIRLNNQTTEVLNRGQENRVRSGFRNRQRIGKRMEAAFEPVGRFIKKQAIIATYVYQMQFDSKPTTISNITIASLAPTTATIQWDTNHLTRSAKVNYGTSNTDPYTGSVIDTDDVSDHHSVTLTGLTPATTYYFEVMNQNGDYVFDAYYSLTTPTEGSEEVTDQLSPRDVIIKGEEPISVLQEPQPEADSITQVNPNDRFRALNQQDGWVSILLPSGAQGWLLPHQVEIVEQQQPSAYADRKTY